MIMWGQMKEIGGTMSKILIIVEGWHYARTNKIMGEGVVPMNSNCVEGA